MRRSAASRDIHRERGEGFVARGHLLVNRQQYERVFADGNKLRGAHFWFKSKDNLWWLGVIHTVDSAGKRFVVRFLDSPGPVKLMLHPELYSTDPSACRCSWCLQRHKSSRVAAGVQRHCIDLA